MATLMAAKSDAPSALALMLGCSAMRLLSLPAFETELCSDQPASVMNRDHVQLKPPVQG